MNGNTETKRARPMRKPVVTNASFVIKPVKRMTVRSDFKPQYPVLEHSSSPRAAAGTSRHGKRSNRANRTGETFFPFQQLRKVVEEVDNTQRSNNALKVNKNVNGQTVAFSEALNHITALGRILKRSSVNTSSDTHNGLINAAFYGHAPPKPTYFTPSSPYNAGTLHHHGQGQGLRVNHANSRSIYTSGDRTSTFRNRSYEQAAPSSRRLITLPVVLNGRTNELHYRPDELPLQDALREGSEDAAAALQSLSDNAPVDSIKREQVGSTNNNTDAVERASVAESLPAKVPLHFLRRQPSARTWRTWRRADESDAYTDVHAYIADNELMSSEKSARIARWINDVDSSRADDVTRSKNVKLAPTIRPVATVAR